MTFKSVKEAAGFIEEHFMQFAGEEVFGKGDSLAEEVITKAVEFLNKERAAKSVNFKAKTMMSGMLCDAVVTVSAYGKHEVILEVKIA